jgi:hypothetical protein
MQNTELTLTINGENNLEITPGTGVYEGTTDTWIEWDDLPEQHATAMEEILVKLGITAADSWGFKTDDWHQWDEAPEGLRTAVESAEVELKGLIARAAQVAVTA